ncbi:MAG: acetyl-CoA decarbonylase/synthase complex subunit delta [Actinobacteria bacterium]|nr:acetyl-CoA decarbonylase/synthase complex subunit delta [Actinomycetota bacterium]MCG2788987.1 acetyl-CoA decarbonylase/synthase complex subunit delta [Actinomycetes bacterium]
MNFQIPKDEYTGKINTLKLGKDKTEVLVGGESVLPFYSFDGETSNKPAIALDVFDMTPTNWPEYLLNYFKDVADDPIKWAKKCIEEFGADAICLHLTKINPEMGSMTPEEAGELVKSIREAIDKPLIVYADAPLEIVAEVMKKVSEKNSESNILLGWVEEDNYKTLAASTIGYKNNLIALDPLDVNIAKQINILLTQLGLSADRIAMDPSSSGLGYGIEYCFSAMERLKIAALLQDDKMTQMPIINNIAAEIWKVKEVKESEEAYPEWGNLEERGINWETISAMCMLLSGSNIITMRHPKAVKLIKEIISELL